GRIDINAPITATGSNAGLVLNHGADGYHLAPGTSVTLSGSNATFRVNGQGYTLIHDVDSLQAMKSNLGGNYALAVDIDASATDGWNLGAGFEPVGNSTSRFTGTFDGLGHTISGLTIKRPSQNYVGLFGYADNATIRNVGLTGGSVR